jgi:hypothetical protein
MLLFVTKALTGIPIGEMMREGWPFLADAAGCCCWPSPCSRRSCCGCRRPWVSPQARAGQEASQATMLIYGSDRRSQVTSCIAAAPVFLLRPEDAIGIVTTQVELIEQAWSTVCAEANLSEVARQYFWRWQFLNRFAFFGAPGEICIGQG